MSSIHYAKITLCSDRGADIEVEVSYELDGSDFDVEEINIDGTVYDMTKQSYARRQKICQYIEMRVDVWEKIMEHEHFMEDMRRESYELRDL